MISPKSRSISWIENVTGKMDPGLTERMIMAFILVEILKTSGLEFVFKGGTSLSLITGKLRRYSIDIDIVVSPKQKLESFLNYVMDQGVFDHFEEDIRSSKIPVRHIKFYYPSSFGQEKYVLLDILFEQSMYSNTFEALLESPLLVIDGNPSVVICPTPDCLLGDKLTAFAPHTTGIRYKNDKDLEIAKQLFDIGILFDISNNLHSAFETYIKIANAELTYRHLSPCTLKDVAFDTFETAYMIGIHGQDGIVEEYNELKKWNQKIKKLYLL